MTFKAIHGMAPDYICKFIQPKEINWIQFPRIQQKSYACGSKRQDTPNTW